MYNMVSHRNVNGSLHSQNPLDYSHKLRSSNKLTENVTNKGSQLVDDTSSSLDLKQNYKYRFCCPDCSYKTDLAGTYNRHILIHSRPFFSCNKCPYKTSRWEVFQTHKQGHDQPGLFSCHNCDFKSHLLSNLKLHTCYNFTCTRCQFKTKSPITFNNHMENHPPPSQLSSENGIFACSECNFRTRVKGSLKLHKLIHFRLPLTCSHCDFTTTFKKLLTIHERSHFPHNYDDYEEDSMSESSSSSPPRKAKFNHKNVETLPLPREKKVFTCPLCGFSSSSDSHFKEHLATHDKGGSKQASPDSTSEEKYTCLICSFNTGNFGVLMRHFMLKHFDGKTSKDEESAKDKPLTKPIVKNDHKKNMKWSVEEKKEVYWCHIYATSEVFERKGVAIRRRDMMIKRGILDPKKISLSLDSRFNGIVINMKTKRTKVTVKELREIEESVKQSIKYVELLHLEAYPHISSLISEQ